MSSASKIATVAFLKDERAVRGGLAVSLPAAGENKRVDEALTDAFADRTSGVVRVHGDGVEAAIVLREGRVVGSARARNGDWFGTAEQLVELGLISEEAVDTLDPRRTAADPSGALDALAETHGVNIRVVEAELRAFVEDVVQEAERWPKARVEQLALSQLRDLGPTVARVLLRLLLADGLTPADLGWDTNVREAPVESADPREPTWPLDPTPAAEESAEASTEEPFEEPDWNRFGPAPQDELAALAAPDEPSFTPETSSVEEISAGPQVAAGAVDGPNLDDAVADEVAPLFDDDTVHSFDEAALTPQVLFSLLSVTTSVPARPLEAGEVLVVDDNAELVERIANVLEYTGMSVRKYIKSETALRFLEQASSNRIRTILVADLFMPRIDGTGVLGGLEILERAKSLLVPPSVILIGSHATGEARERARDLGVDVFRQRPSSWGDEAENKKFFDDLVEVVLALQRGDPVDARSPTTEATETAQLEPEVDIEASDRLWREAMRELSETLSRPEVLLLVLRFASEVLSRAVLFRVDGEALVGTGQFGLTLATGQDPDDAVRQIRISRSGHPLFAAAEASRSCVRATSGDTSWEQLLVERLGGARPDEVFVGPVFCGRELVAAVYGDGLPMHARLGDTTNLEVFLFQASMALERDALNARLSELEKNDPEI